MLRALTVCQPWAWAIMAGKKQFENRTWGTNYRGTLLIHAGKSEKYMGAVDELRVLGLDPPIRFAFGAILGSVELLECVAKTEWLKRNLRRDPFAEGPVLWCLDRPRRLFEPIPCDGRQGLFGIAERVLAGATWADEAPSTRGEKIVGQCPCGRQIIAALDPTPGHTEPRLFVHICGEDELRRITVCPTCGRDFSRLTAEQIKTHAWQS